jgi:hypothetical protein
MLVSGSDYIEEECDKKSVGLIKVKAYIIREDGDKSK